jgi:hypothetical protein
MPSLHNEKGVRGAKENQENDEAREFPPQKSTVD